jgi:dihydrofolate reductase/thymidylate synthase
MSQVQPQPQRLYNIIVAYTFGTRGIGLNGELPWHISADMAYFKSITTMKSIHETPSTPSTNIVVMGRKTWDSIPAKFKPLSDRFNIVITNGKPPVEYNNPDNNLADKLIFINWEQFIALDLSHPKYGQIFIIGGETIYKKILDMDNKCISRIYATEIYDYKGQCDTYFPQFIYQDITEVTSFIQSNGYWIRHIVYNVSFTYNIQTNIQTNMQTSGDAPVWLNIEENNYLQVMKSILESGTSNDDRTGVGTLSVFGEMLKYNLRDTFPITTTKRIPARQIFEELMFYISGKTDNTILQEKSIHIWDANTTRAFLDKRGLNHYKVGDFGETYGFNMRHYGGEYIGCDVEYSSGYGYDQLTNAIELIKNEPASRRIIIDLWNPATQHKAALPSCLCKYQFNVNVTRSELNLAIYLRSSDYFLANNWNTCTGAFLVHMICNLNGVDLTPGELTVFIADAHIYKFHIEQVKVNLARQPYPYPMLVFKGCVDNSSSDSNSNKANKKNSIDEFKWDDFELLGYKAHAGIKAPMAV